MSASGIAATLIVAPLGPVARLSLAQVLELRAGLPKGHRNSPAALLRACRSLLQPQDSDTTGRHSEKITKPHLLNFGHLLRTLAPVLYGRGGVAADRRRELAIGFDFEAGIFKQVETAGASAASRRVILRLRMYGNEEENLMLEELQPAAAVEGDEEATLDELCGMGGRAITAPKRPITGAPRGGGAGRPAVVPGGQRAASGSRRRGRAVHSTDAVPGKERTTGGGTWRPRHLDDDDDDDGGGDDGDDDDDSDERRPCRDAAAAGAAAREQSERELERELAAAEAEEEELRLSWKLAQKLLASEVERQRLAREAATLAAAAEAEREATRAATRAAEEKAAGQRVRAARAVAHAREQTAEWRGRAATFEAPGRAAHTSSLRRAQAPGRPDPIAKWHLLHVLREVAAVGRGPARRRSGGSGLDRLPVRCRCG